jgi:hypothetical protein
MASIDKVAFNIDGLTIYSTLNILVLNEISFVDARMLNVINNMVRSIKYIHKKFFSGVDVVMTNDFFQKSPIKDSWIFQNIKDNTNALTPNFWQTYVQCYELNIIMQ